MSEAIIGLVSAFGVVILKGLFDYLMDRRKRKDSLEDKQSQEESAILIAIGELKEEIGRIRAELKKTTQDINDLSAREERDEILQARVRILRFADELTLKTPLHSKEHFQQTLLDITQYEAYCEKHPDFKNEITVSSAGLIREVYNERLRKNDFL